MGQKSDNKRQYILETSRNLFAARGFKDVTMKDIVDACKISRGGLYLYFGSTAEIFGEVIRMETGDTDEEMSESISRDTSVSDILGLFLEEQKKETETKIQHLLKKNDFEKAKALMEVLEKTIKEMKMYIGV